FGFHIGEASQEELSEASCLLDLSEHRLDDLLSQPVATSPSGPPEFGSHCFGQPAGEVWLAALGMFGPTDRDIAADAAFSQGFEVSFAAVACIGRSLLRPAAQIGPDAVEQRHELVLVTGLCHQAVG